MLFFWILGASILETILSLVGQAAVFFGGDNIKKYIRYLVSFAIGTLLAVVFLDILPEALEFIPAEPLFMYVLAGFISFFILAKFLFWYHCHNGECPVHGSPSLILLGDAVHNFIDGIVIALAFIADFDLGLITTFAVLLHEFPQEMSDFFVLVRRGYGPQKALMYNFLTAATTVAGGVLTYFFARSLDFLIGPALGLVAGNFLYIAASDLLPELRSDHETAKTTLLQFGFVFLGIFLIYFVGLVI